MYFQQVERVDYQRPAEFTKLNEFAYPFNERIFVQSVGEGIPMWGGSYHTDPSKGFRYCIYFAERKVFDGRGRLVDFEVVPGGKLLKCVQTETEPTSGTFYEAREIFDPKHTLLNQMYQSEAMNSFFDIILMSQTPRITVYTQYYCDTECISHDRWKELKKKTSDEGGIRNGGIQNLERFGVQVSTGLTFPRAEWFRPHYRVKVFHPTLGKTTLPGYFSEVLSVTENEDADRVICGAMTSDYVFTRFAYVRH